MNTFTLGRLVATRGVADAADSDQAFAAFVRESLLRYIACDWGDLCEEDKRQNDSAVAHGDARILAAYVMDGPRPRKISIITEWDRSYTTILFPDEY